MIRQPPSSPLFPHTPLFRSSSAVTTCTSSCGSRTSRAAPVPSTSSSRQRNPSTSTVGCGSKVPASRRSEEHTSELQSRQYLVCRLLLEKKKQTLVYSTHLHI